MEVLTILWREWIFFKRRFWHITSALIISPLLYIVTFGYGIGDSLIIDGKSYLFYILPGVISLTVMRTSYSAIAMRISISRLHEKSFENYIISPTRMQYLTLGHVLAGSLRGLYAGFLIVLIVSIFGIYLNVGFVFLGICILNSLLFSSLGFIAAMWIDTHYDMNRFTSFVITPMSFLCGTFFSLEEMPSVLKFIIELLPLTHSTQLLRSVVFGKDLSLKSIIIVVFYILVFFILSIKVCYREDRS